jgi:multimeric flavodoxin WrbA
VSNTQALVDASRAIMDGHGVSTDVVRLVDHDVATGVWPDMTAHGWAIDEWPAIQEMVFAADILVVAGPIWLGDNSSVTKQCIEPGGPPTARFAAGTARRESGWRRDVGV